MTGDLTAFRNHARRMVTAKHGPACPGRHPVLTYLKPDPKVCGGCVPDEDRALWAQLANEVDAHLARTTDPDDDTVADRTQEETLIP